MAGLGGVPILVENLGPDGPGGTGERPGGTANIFISTPRAPGQTGGENGGIKTPGEIGGPGAGDMVGVSGCIAPGGGIPSGPKGEPIMGKGIPTCWLSLPVGLLPPLPPLPTLLPLNP